MLPVRRRVRAVVASALLLTTLTACRGGADGSPGADHPDEQGTSEAATDQPDEDAEAGFRDWLAPAQEIKVGPYRYVSPCQLLSEDAIDAALGDPVPGSNYRNESYLDTSTATSKDRGVVVETTCSWQNGLFDGKSVTVRVEQSPARDIDDQTFLRSSSEATDARKQLARWAKVDLARSATPEETAAFIGDLKAGQAALKAADTTYRSTFEAGTSLAKGTMWPTDGLGDTFNFTGQVGNLQWSLGADGWTGRSDLQLLDTAAALTREIRTNLADETLSQSPGALVRGETDRAGTTPVLDPCAVLTVDMLTTFSGARQNEPVERSVPPVDLLAPSERGRIEPSGHCTRSYSANSRTAGQRTAAERKLDDGYANLDLGLLYFPTEAAARAFWRSGSAGKTIRTKATKARVWPSTGTVWAYDGPYVFSITADIVSIPDCPAYDCGEETIPLSPAATVKLANAVVDNLRAQSAQASQG